MASMMVEKKDVRMVAMKVVYLDLMMVDE